MFIHGFRSEFEAELRLYTAELVCHETVDDVLEVAVREPRYLVLAALRSLRTKGGFENHRASLTYDIHKGFEMSSHWGTGAFKHEELEEINTFVQEQGPALVKWMKKCPVTPTRGRSLFTP